MPHTGLDIEKLPSRLGSARSLVVAPSAQAKSTVDEPKSVWPAVSWYNWLPRIDRRRLKSALRFSHELPRCIRLINMGISVNYSCCAQHRVVLPSWRFAAGDPSSNL
jgi:hypothetical protein